MGMLKKAIKDNVMSGNTKYKGINEKIGQVLDSNENEKTCTISVITRDGISSIEYNVIVKCEEFPSVGDYVALKEQYKKFTIEGIIDVKDLNTALNGDIYSDIYGGGVNGYVGY